MSDTSGQPGPGWEASSEPPPFPGGPQPPPGQGWGPPPQPPGWGPPPTPPSWGTPAGGWSQPPGSPPSGGPPGGGAPILLSYGGPQPQRRWTILIRLILAIPHIVILAFFGVAVFFIVIIGWFASLVMGELPIFCRDLITGYLLWYTRVSAYLLLLTDVYPPFSVGEEPGYPVRIAIPPATTLNRLAVFFRIILVIPASIIAQVIGGYFLFLLAFVGWIVSLVAGELPPAMYQVFAAVIRYETRLFGYFTMVTPEYPWGPYGDTVPYVTPGWELVLSSAAKVILTVGIVINVIAGGAVRIPGGRNNSSNTYQDVTLSMPSRAQGSPLRS